MLEDARTNKELAREQQMRQLMEAAEAREELTHRLDASRREKEETREKKRQQAVIDHIKALPVGGGLPSVFVY